MNAWGSRHGVLTGTAGPNSGTGGEKAGRIQHQDTTVEKKEARRRLRKRHRLTQITIGFLQGRAAFGQNVHSEHRLWFHLHREGGDGTLIDTFGHVVVQTFSQLLDIAAEVPQALSILRLQQTGNKILQVPPQYRVNLLDLHPLPPCLCKP